MPTRFTLPHIDITAFYTKQPYASGGGGRATPVRNREQHAARLQAELDAAFALRADVSSPDDRLPAPTGTYIEVELRHGSNADQILDKPTLKIRPLAVRDVTAGRLLALYVPDETREAFAKILEDYRHGPLSPNDQPPRKSIVEAIDAFRQARLETLWTDDPEAMPTAPHDEIWWAVWVERSNEAALDDVVLRLALRAAGRERRLRFPEVVVVPVYAPRVAIELMMFKTGLIIELRRATDNPSFFLDDVRLEQTEWNEDLAERIEWPGLEVPAVCLLDTGINRGHVLLEPAVAARDLHVIVPEWGVDDHDDHGTAMAGLALHGDLTAPLGSQDAYVLAHRLESVKVLPPNPRDTNDPNSYGAITQAAVALPEIEAPDRTRVFCMAITNGGVSGARPSTWSAAIDQAAIGKMPGDDAQAPRRLFVVAVGNTEPVTSIDQLLGHAEYPAEDPAQAWNVMSIGGYTDLDQIVGKGYEDWSHLAAVGDLSPHSRTSVAWEHSRTPVKPDLVLEAGNRAVSPSGKSLVTLESLSLLSTGRDVDRYPLVPFQATSAATATAARMAARLMAAHPDYWPETIRALMVHSAEYTPRMLEAFAATKGLKERYLLIRRFGHGVPDFDRANASASDSLALLAQTTIQPYRLKGNRKFNECHYFSLPLPTEVLADLNNELVDLKVTLSYFIEPNPGFSANVDPQSYQSFGLRFDLRRRGESIPDFKKRVNVAERESPKQGGAKVADDGRWLLGPDSMSAGSLHSDTWTGPAVDLLGRNLLCVKPVGGWWRDRADGKIVNSIGRYAMIVTLKARRLDIDLHTPIVTLVERGIAIESEVEIRSLL